MHKWNSEAAPLCSVQITLGFMDMSPPIIFCPILEERTEQEDRRKQYFIYIAVWQTSQKHQRNGVNPALKQTRQSAERKHHTQRTSWGDVGEAVQILHLLNS